MATDNAYVVAASAARTATGNSNTFSCEWHEFLSIALSVTAVSGTSPTLVVTVEWSMDGATWFTPETGNATAFASINAAKNQLLRVPVLAPYFRLKWTIGGTTPSFTFTATGYNAKVYNS